MTELISNDHLWYWINNIKNVGRKTINNLFDYFGNLKELYYADSSQIEYFLNNNKTRIVLNDFIESRNADTIIKSYDKLSDNNIRFIHRESIDYPERFRNIPDPPYGLYLKGKLPDQDKKAIAIIGARNSTHYGREMARLFANELSKYGIIIVSGLARGIDGRAHAGALEADKYTLGILGCGIDQVYPKENYELFIEMEKSGGILSESNIGIAPNVSLFPQRNRLISGISDGILVVEAREKSGTFITVDQGLEQGKEIFALPGRVLDSNSKGCNNLIKMGAHIVTDTYDILEVLSCNNYEFNDNNVKQNGLNNIDKSHSKRSKTDFTKRSMVTKNLLAPVEKIVYSVLSVEPKFIDDIISETKIAPQQVCMILNKLSVDGVVIEPFRNYFSIRL